MKNLLIVLTLLLIASITSASWTAQATYPTPSGGTRGMSFGYMPTQGYNFDAVAIRMVEGDLGTPSLTFVSDPSWQLCLDTPTEAALFGDARPVDGMRFAINFADYYNTPIVFDLVLFDGDNIVVNQRVQNNPATGFWTIGTPGSGQWLPARNEIPEPVTALLLGAGILLTRRIR